MSTLTLRDVHVTYTGAHGDVPAVRGVDLTVASGHALGIVGESGCGKTTLTSAILRLLPKEARVTGAIEIDGEDVLGMSFARLRAVRWAGASVVFQGAMHALNPVQSIGAQIAEPLLIHGQASGRQAQQRVGELLEQVGLPARRAADYPHQLSGGQKQRVMIAMALACRPGIIIADEPTTALDVMVQAQVLDVLTTLVREAGVSLVMISHDLSVVADVCDSVAVMYAGQVVEEGPAADVFDDPRHPYSKALSAAFPRIGDPAFRYAPSGLLGDPPQPTSLPSGCAFHPRCAIAADFCRAEVPLLRSLGSSRHVRCHLAEPRVEDQRPAESPPGGSLVPGETAGGVR